MKTPRKHKGAETELKAVVWLLEQGYEVFRNVSQHGYADLVAILDGNVTLIDVSTQLKARNEQQEPVQSAINSTLQRMNGRSTVQTSASRSAIGQQER